MLSRSSISAMLALLLAAASATSIDAAPDLNVVTPIAGGWTYNATADGSEAQFTASTGYGQLWLHCTRATRRVSIARLATIAAPSVDVWTSSATRKVASSFSPSSGRLTIEFENYDPLLDAIATSRGRIGFSIGSEPALVVPAWADVARVIEDCRS